MTAEIIYALDYAKQERDIRVVVLAAKGDVFCAGGNLVAMSGKGSETKVSNTIFNLAGAIEVQKLKEQIAELNELLK